MQLEVLDFFFLFWRFIYSSFPHLLQAVTSTSTQRLNVCWICVALSSKISAVEKKKKNPCISVSTFSGTKRNRRRHILLCLNWIWGGFSTSQTVVDFSHLCRAPCCLHNPGHYGFFKKSPQFGAVRLFFFLFFFSQDGKKTTVDLLISFFFFLFGRKLCKRSLEWMGWGDNETDGRFLQATEILLTGAKRKKKKKQKTTAEARREEENMGLFQKS